MLSGDNEVLIAGRPTVLWGATSGTDTILSRNEVFGVLLRSDRTAHVIANPVEPALVRPLTAGAIRPKSWGFIFAEIDPGADTSRWRNSNEGDLKRLLYAEYTDGIWSVPEPIPSTGISRLIATNGSTLVRSADTLVWAVPAMLPDGAHYAAVFERVDGSWNYQPLDPGYGPLASYLAAIHTSAGFRIARVHADTGVGFDSNSLFVYTRDRGWHLEGKLISGQHEPVHAPSWLASPVYESVLTWLAPVPGAGTQARSIWGSPPLRGARTVIADSRAWDTAVPLLDWLNGPFWLSHHTSNSGESQLRVSRARGSGSETLWTTGNPYTGFARAASRDRRSAYVSGPVLDTAARTLKSLIIELQLACST